ncbi:MAG: signal peptidase I [Sphingomonadales bacterium]|nr:signal peptidase I [Sphingomonadales bacterium]MBD3774693.1 signal peptidase I [Paracoccaceae bacterium]
MTAQQAGAASGAPDTTPAKPKKKDDGFFLFLIKLVAVVLIFRSFIFAPFSIPSESMLPALENGDYLLAAKWPYGYSKYSLPFDAPLIPGRILSGLPEHGDVVIFKHPVDGSDYIKRAIGLPGDTIEMRNGELFINDAAVKKERIADFAIPVSPNTSCAWGAAIEMQPDGSRECVYARFRETLPSGRTYNVLDFGPTPQDNFGPIVVPDGHIFVMGDNRDNSQDSRFPATPGGGVGMVAEEDLVGRATVIMWSTDGGAEWIKPWTWFTAARWGRIGSSL